MSCDSPLRRRAVSHSTVTITMADPSTATDPPPPQQTATDSDSAVVAAVVAAAESATSRKEKRILLKKQKRKQLRREAALLEREEEERRANDPQEQIKLQIKEREEFEAAERERRAFEERERLWIEAIEKKKKLLEEEEEERKKILEELERNKIEHSKERDEDDDEWEYIEEGPAEIIWQGNEIIVKKKKIKVPKKYAGHKHKEDDDRPFSNPLPPQSTAFASNNTATMVTAQDVLESAAQQIPNFGTEQDKTHCPFHLKTGVCRFGTRCSRVHFYPDKSCTLLIKSMYNGPGLAWEQDEGLEYTDEEVERYYEDFYEDVHTEFLKFGELVNFKVCRNGSYHLRGNVYVHYMSVESAVLAYNTMNGRYFGGKQITCEFVSITRWKVAICGEYMKTRLKTCSRGTACNFIHCFRNPGGDYEWADWDNPPPKYWVRKMAALFGPSDEPGYDNNVELEDYETCSDARKKKHRNHRDSHIASPYIERRHRTGIIRSTNREHSSKRRKMDCPDNGRRSEDNYVSKGHDLKCSPRDSDPDSTSKYGLSQNNHKDHEKSSNRDHKKRKERHKARDKCSSKTQGQRDEHEKFHQVYVENYKSDWHLNNRDGERYGSNWHSDYIGDDTSHGTEGHSSGSPFGRCSIDSQDRYEGRYCYDDLYSDGDSYRNKRAHESSGSCKRENYGCGSHYRSKQKSKSSEKHHKKSETRSFRDDIHEFTSDDGPDGGESKGRYPRCKSSKVRSPGGIDPTSTETVVEELEDAPELSRPKEASHHRRHSKDHKRRSHCHGKDHNKAEEGKCSDRQMLKV